MTSIKTLEENDLTIADKKYKWIINGIETPKSEVNTTDSKSYPPNFRFLNN
jgi:hypothetical protein